MGKLYFTFLPVLLTDYSVPAHPPIGDRSDDRLSVCPQAYLWNYMSDLHHFFVHVTYMYIRGSVLLCRRCDTLSTSGLWMTSCSYIMARNERRTSDSVGSSMDLPPWRILKLTHQWAAPDRGRSLISMIASLVSGLTCSSDECKWGRGVFVSPIGGCTA